MSNLMSNAGEWKHCSGIPQFRPEDAVTNDKVQLLQVRRGPTLQQLVVALRQFVVVGQVEPGYLALLSDGHAD